MLPFEFSLESWDEAALLGKSNILEIVRDLRRSEQSMTVRIKSLKKRIEKTRELNPETAQEQSLLFENPEFHEVGILRDGFEDIEPLSEEDIYREAGSTTFNVCGWCRYMAGGSSRYQYQIEGSCSLLEMRDRVYFDTPCFLKNLSEGQKKESISLIEKKISEIKVRRNQTRSEIKKLQGLAKVCEDKVLFPRFRKESYFQDSDIVLYCASIEDVSAPWVRARITGINDRGLHKVKSEFKLGKGRRQNFALSHESTIILLQSEFDELRRADEEFVLLWVKDRVIFSGLSPEKFLSDLRKGDFVSEDAVLKVKEKSPSIRGAEECSKLLGQSLQNLKTSGDVEKAADRRISRLLEGLRNPRSKAVKDFSIARLQEIKEARDFLIQKINAR